MGLCEAVGELTCDNVCDWDALCDGDSACDAVGDCVGGGGSGMDIALMATLLISVTSASVWSALIVIPQGLLNFAFEPAPSTWPADHTIPAIVVTVADKTSMRRMSCVYVSATKATEPDGSTAMPEGL